MRSTQQGSLEHVWSQAIIVLILITAVIISNLLLMQLCSLVAGRAHSSLLNSFWTVSCTSLCLRSTQRSR